MATMSHHILAKTATDAILEKFKTGAWTYGSGWGADFFRTGTPAEFPSPDAAFYDSVNKKLAYFEFKPDTESKRGILTGVGQSIAYLENSNLSYLVAPKMLSGFRLDAFLTDLYANQLSGKVPTGLILYDNSNPVNVTMVHNVGILSGNAAAPRSTSSERFWAKHQDLPIPLFHLILHYYFLKKVGLITGDPFAECFSNRFISKDVLSTFSTQVVKDVAGNTIKTLGGRKDITFLEKKIRDTSSMSTGARRSVLFEAIDTTSTRDNYYNSTKKNYISFLKHLQMINSVNELTETGFFLYQLGLVNGPTSKIFYDYFIKELLITGHHLDVILDFDKIKNSMVGMGITDVLSAMETDYERKGYIKRNPGRVSGTTRTVEFLKYERILWKHLGLIDSSNTVQWKKITEICSLPEL